MTRKEKQERKMTRVLLAITFSFLILLAWQCITQCFYMLGVGKKNTPESNQWNVTDVSFAFAKLGVIINSSINWIFYCYSGSTFRKIMIGMFTCGKVYNRYSTRSSMTNSTANSVVLANSNV